MKLLAAEEKRLASLDRSDSSSSPEVEESAFGDAVCNTMVDVELPLPVGVISLAAVEELSPLDALELCDGRDNTGMRVGAVGLLGARGEQCRPIWTPLKRALSLRRRCLRRDWWPDGL